MAVQSFTGRHFSPLLISRELDRVRDPSAMSTLKDEALTVRVSSMANEVKAIYTVDEQTMEVAIRVPSEYPLQSIEVVDIKKVGIAEAQWRAWLLAIQQTVTTQVRALLPGVVFMLNHVTQSGTILEALSLFKRNVSLHFEGVEACASAFLLFGLLYLHRSFLLQSATRSSPSPTAHSPQRHAGPATTNFIRAVCSRSVP